MKSKFKLLSLILSLLLVFSFGLTACGGTGDGGNSGTSAPIGGDDDDEEVDTSGKDVISFWYSGEDAEQNVFTDLVSTFNDTIGEDEGIYVDAEYASNVDEAIGNRLGTSSCPDVFYVGDGSYKKYVEAGHLLDITAYATNSTDANPADMWGSIYDRYYYNKTTNRSGKDAGDDGAWYGLPKDIGPTVLYYNETMFTEAGVTVLSVAEEDLFDFNTNSSFKDARGKTKAQLGIQGTVPAKGYFIDGGNMFFNNQVAMNWKEVRDLATVIRDDQTEKNPNVTVYGYHTEWWFAYGWSVGGDCIQYIDAQDSNYDGGGYYDFTLVDDTKNFMANEDVVVNGTQYAEGEIISYQDKLTNEVDLAGKNNKAAEAVYASEIMTNNTTVNSSFTELPSQREAFIEFVLLSTDTDVAIEGKYGYNVCAKPTAMGGDGAKTTTFKNKQLGMLVDGRWNVTDFRESLTFEWDVAPLPMYKEYDTDGNIVKRGVESGHSGSVALSISSKTQYPDQAWKFVEFLAGKKGQTQQSLAGFAIPSQRDLAYGTDNGPNGGGIFVNQKDTSGNLLRPYNAIVFCRAAENEHEGDWAYTETGSAWIDGWAGLLNGDVRDGDMTFEAFLNDSVFMSTYESLKDLTKKKAQ